ncbi:MAG: ABC transporter permease [Chloroflexota bacterium]
MLSKVVENIRIAITALVGNRVRSFLTMLGITIGVASVILLMSVGQAVERFVIGEFSSFGSNLVVVFGKISNEVYDTLTVGEDEQFELFIPLTEDDLAALQNPFNVPDAAVVGAAVAVSDGLEYRDEEFEPQIVGITPNYLQAYNFSIGIGEPLNWDHVDAASRVAVIGQDVVEDVFDGAFPIGETIEISGLNFEVIGVWDQIDSALNPQVNDIVVLPITTVQRRIIREQTNDGSYPITEIVIKARDESAVPAVVEQVRETMRESHDLAADEQDDFVVFSQNELLSILDTTTSLLTGFLATIAGISLLVGGIGIMNIMLVTVTERTREIGVRKAMGAQRSDILTQFLIESVTLALIGGAIGTAIAASLALLTGALVPNLDVGVSLGSIALAAGISLAIGVFFGVYPANRAARMNPIDALRYE